MKRYVTFALMFMALLILPGCGTETPVEESIHAEVVPTGFATPEDAMVAYLEGLRDGDLGRMTGAFAIEAYIANHDYEAMIERLGVYMFNSDPRIPNANELVTALNVENRRGQITMGIIMQYMSLAYPEFDALVPHPMSEEEGGAAAFTRRLNDNLNSLDLSSLEILGFIPPGSLSDLYDTEQNQENLARRADIAGADQITGSAAVFVLDGKQYLLLTDLVQYGEHWYLYGLGGHIGALLGLSVETQGIAPAAFVAELDLPSMMVPVE